jgi:hypothetical protein
MKVFFVVAVVLVTGLLLVVGMFHLLARMEANERRENARRKAKTTPNYPDSTNSAEQGVDASLPSADVLAGLPGCFYAVAVLVGIGLGITTIAVIGNGGSAEEIGYMIGSTIGGVLSILATGRLIELVGRISENVRAIRERTDSQK